MQNKKPSDYLIDCFFFRPLVNDTIANINKTIPTGYLTLGSTAGIIMKITNAIISTIIPLITSIISISTPLKSTISKQWFLNNIFGSKKTSDYLGFFFLIWLIVWLIPKKITPKITPKAPIIYGMPISYIFIVVGQISLIRYPKIQDIAEMIMRIIPIIKNPFFVSILYSLSSIKNILINIILSSSILYKMKEFSFFSFFSFDFEQKQSFFGGFNI